jgi:transglutaminase-like putative cysteine protease
VAPRRAFAATPDWVRQAASQTLPSYSAETNAVLLLDATEITLLSADEYQEHYRRVVKLLRQEGRNEAEVGISFRQQDKIVSLHAWSIDSTGHEYELKDKDFIERNSFTEELYSDIRARRATIPGAAPGTVIAFEFERRRHLWVNQLQWFLQEDIPVRETSYTVQFPAGWEYQVSWSGTPLAQPAASSGRVQWTVHDLPAIEHEPLMPQISSLSARMDITYFAPGNPAFVSASWDGLGKWYSTLANGRRTLTPEIADKTRQLLAGKTSFDDKLRTLATFVQGDVRYVAIEIGIGGHQPHYAVDIFHARYGDCKDKATLLSTMLQEAGIRSNYVLIDTDRGFVKPSLPSSLSDHAILAIELPDDVKNESYHSVVTLKNGKRYLLFDPTNSYLPVGWLAGYLQDSYALLVTDSGGELVHTPILPPEQNVLSRTGHFILDSSGSLSGEVDEDRSGDRASSERGALLHVDQQNRTKHWERRLSGSLQGFTLKDVSVQQLDEFQKDLLLTYHFVAPQYGQARGPLMLVRPRVLGVKSFDIERKPRHNPIEFDEVTRETDTYEIEVPSDYVVDDVPGPVKLDVGFASYQSKITVEGKQIRYWREYVLREPMIGADRVADLRKFEGTIGGDENSAVVLKKVAP